MTNWGVFADEDPDPQVFASVLVKVFTSSPFNSAFKHRWLLAVFLCAILLTRCNMKTHPDLTLPSSSTWRNPLNRLLEEYRPKIAVFLSHVLTHTPDVHEQFAADMRLRGTIPSFFIASQYI